LASIESERIAPFLAMRREIPRTHVTEAAGRPALPPGDLETGTAATLGSHRQAAGFPAYGRTMRIQVAPASAHEQNA